MSGGSGTGGHPGAGGPGFKGWWSTWIAPRVRTWVAVILVLLVLTLAVVMVIPPRSFGYGVVLPNLLLLAFVLLLLATALSVRNARRRDQVPGRWLRRRAVRRGLVAIIAVDCLAIASGDWGSGLSNTTIANLVTGLIVLNIALGRATQRLATAIDTGVDERQEHLRNSAHRVAYWGLAVAIGTVLVIADSASPATRTWLGHSILGGSVWVFLEYLFVLPAMVIAWREPDLLQPDAAERRRSTRHMVAIALGVLAASAVVIGTLATAFLPASTDAWHRPQSAADPLMDGLPPVAAGPPGIACEYFQADTHIGGWGADIPLHAVACWDGKAATEVWGLNRGDCAMDSAVFAVVNTVECARRTDRDGTLHFTYRADVHPALLPFVVRHITMALVLDRNGHIVRFP